STTTPAAAPNPSIVSDQPDYAPGGTVTLTGSGWSPGEAVHVFVDDSDGHTWSYSADVVADLVGGFTNRFQLPNSFVSNYSVDATGSVSGTVHTSFTDGNVQFNLDAAEPVANMTVPYTKYNTSNNCTTGGSAQTT